MANRQLAHIQKWIEKVDREWQLNLLEEEVLEKVLKLIKDSDFNKLEQIRNDSERILQ